MSLERINLDQTGYPAQFITTLKTHREAVRFILEHRLWDGFWKYGWVSGILIGLAILFGLKSVSIFMNWLDHFNSAETQSVVAEMGVLMESMAFESYNFLFVGGLKYVMLILLEVIIFHLCRRTMEILTDSSSDLSFKTFMKAQIRMIKVVFRTYLLEIGCTILIKILFSMFGFYDFLEPVLIFAVQCYFLGFLVMDNYNEQFHLSIKESVQYAKQFMGVSLATGFILNIIILIPVIGAIIGPMIAAVALTLVMFRISDPELMLQDQATESHSDIS